MPGLSYIVLCIHCCSSQGARVPLNSVVRNAPLFEHEKSLSIVVTHGSRNLDSLFHRIHCRCSSFEIRPPSQRRAENQYLQLNHSLWNCGSFLSVCTCVREAYLNWLRRERPATKPLHWHKTNYLLPVQFSWATQILTNQRSISTVSRPIPWDELISRLTGVKCGIDHRVSRHKIGHFRTDSRKDLRIPPAVLRGRRPWWKKGWYVLCIEWCR